MVMVGSENVEYSRAEGGKQKAPLVLLEVLGARGTLSLPAFGQLAMD